jgi:hypothetical protein
MRTVAALLLGLTLSPLASAQISSQPPQSQCAPSQVGTLVVKTTAEVGEVWYTYLLPGIEPVDNDTCLAMAGACRKYPVHLSLQDDEFTIGACYQYEVSGNPLTVVSFELLHYNACNCGD